MKNKDNICFVHCVSVIGGAERVSQAIMRGLPTENYALSLVCPEQGELSAECESFGASSLFHNIQQPDFKHPIKTLKSNTLWKKYIDDHHIDIFHTGDLLSTRSLINVAKKQGVKVVCHVHFPFELAFSAWAFGNSHHPDAFIFCSQELQDDVGPMLSDLCPRSGQHVIHNGVDISKYAPVASTFTADQPRIGIVANLQHRKGHDEFLSMAEIVTEKYPDATFDIVGGDIMQEPREPILKTMTETLGLTANVNFHGQVSNVKDLVDKFDIYVCASHEEAFPISILEAMACGKAIVSTNVNGIPEAIIDGESGILINAKAPNEMAEAVLSLLASSEQREALAHNARQRVVENFSEQVFIDKIDALYQQLGN